MAHRIPVLIVVGGGVSGRQFLVSAAQHGLSDHYRIRALDEHAKGPQERDVGGLVAERETVLVLDPVRRVLETASGRTLAYDALVLATGTRAFVSDLSVYRNCFVYPADLDAIRREAGQCRRGVVIGGGRHGLQAAQLLRRLGLETHIVEHASRLLPKWVDDTGAVVLQARIAKLGVEVHLGLALQDISAEEGRVSSVRLSDGREIATDLVIVCPGAHARDELGRASGLKLGHDQEGIAIDECCRTSEADVFAVGSVASFKGHALNWPAARGLTAATAARVLAGERATLPSLEPRASFRALGVEVASFGDAFARAADTAEISLFDSVAATYARLTIGQEGTRLVGGMLVGSIKHYAELHDYYARGLPLPRQPGYLIRILSEGTAKARLTGPPGQKRRKLESKRAESQV